MTASSPPAMPAYASPPVSWREVGLVVGLALFLFLLRLGAPGLMDPDEGRYAQIAREMLATSDFLTPHLNQVKYLEKPPLVYWLTAAALALFGPTETAARLVPALSAVGGILGLWWFGRRLFSPAAALLGAVILATSLGYLLLGRLLTLDMPLTCCLIWGLVLGYVTLTRNRRDLLPYAYLALGLGVLVKGPVAVALPALIFVLFALARRDLRLLLRLGSLPGALLFAVVVLPWFILVSLRNPEFPTYFILHEHLGRFLTPQVHAGRPWWYFLALLPVGLLPWSFLLPWSLWDGWRRTRTGGPTPEYLFLLLWAGVMVAFFSLSHSKLPPYVLPALPPLALIVGQALAGVMASRRFPELPRGLRWSLIIWAGLTLPLAAVFAWWPELALPAPEKIAYLAPFIQSALAILAFMPLVGLLGFRKHRGALPAILIYGALFLCVLGILGMGKVAEVRSPRALAQVLRSHWQPGEILVGYQVYSQGLSFYSGLPFHLLLSSTELDFGRAHTPGAAQLFLPDLPALQAFLAEKPRAYLLLKREARDHAAAQLGRPFTELGAWKDLLLVTTP